MPPFSPDVHQARHYDNDNDNDNNITDADVQIVDVRSVRSMTFDEKTLRSREHTDEKEFVLVGVSDRIGERSEIETHQLQEDEEDSININNGNSNSNSNDDDESESDGGENDVAVAQQQGLEQGCYGRIGLRRTTSLPTILERRVSFAGRVIRNEIHDALQITPIPHVREYTRDDRRRLWYTRIELSRMQKSCFNAALAVSKDTELYCPLYFRGLENLIDHAITLANDTNDSTYESRRSDAIEAVLNEQYQQRFLSLVTHGVVYSGMMDSEQVRDVYMVQGKTKERQSIAHTFALRDEAYAKEWLEEDTNDRRKLEYEDDENDGHYQTGDDLSNGVRWVFQKLLTPFLDIPHGDIYLGMGEECF